MSRKRVWRPAAWIARWPRLVRILIVALFALAVTLALSPLVDYLYDRFFFSMQTREVPSLVSASFGLLMYLLGWWLMVGTVGEKPEARAALLWYIGTGVAALLFVVFLLVRGVSLVNIIMNS